MVRLHAIAIMATQVMVCTAALQLTGALHSWVAVQRMPCAILLAQTSQTARTTKDILEMALIVQLQTRLNQTRHPRVMAVNQVQMAHQKMVPRTLHIQLQLSP